MIFKAKSGAEIIEKINIDENEAIGKFANLNHALVIVKIEEKRHDKDEIGEIGLYSDLKAREESIDEINEKLLEFY